MQTPEQVANLIFDCGVKHIICKVHGRGMADALTRAALRIAGTAPEYFCQAQLESWHPGECEFVPVSADLLAMCARVRPLEEQLRAAETRIAALNQTNTPRAFTVAAFATAADAAEWKEKHKADWARQKIQERAKKIRSELEGSHLYGWPLDMNDPEAVLVAAYALGECNALIGHTDEFQELAALEKGGKHGD